MQLFSRFRLLACIAVLVGIKATGADPTTVQPIEHARQLAFAHRAVDVLVRGVVIEAPGRLPADPRFFHIQDRSGGIAVLPSDRLNLKLGDCVDVVGTTMLFNDLEPQLDARRVAAASAPCAAPETHAFSVDEVRAGRGSGGLVRVSGRVVDSSAGDDRALILIGNDRSPLRAVLRRPGAALAQIRGKTAVGALVEMVGVSLPSADGKSHYLRLRHCPDIVQKAPPPFRPYPAVRWLSALLLGVSGVTFAWIIALRRAVLRKTREISLLLEQAQAASRFKSQFLANMSHEIRTPIHGIMGMQEIVLQSTLEPVQRESLEIAHSATRSLLSLLNDILDLSKIEADSMDLSLEPINLRGLIAELERQFRASARVAGVTFEVLVAPQVPEFVAADPVRLRQVLTNLLSNAFKFTAEGSVTLSCSVAGPPEAKRQKEVAHVHFAVRDTGIGIAASELEKIFSAFHQADGSITRRFGGTGLGLTIASRLVHLMGGTLSCESTVGQGSLFHFEVDLPLAAEVLAVQSPAGDGAPAPVLRVLLAEDNRINQLVVRRPLEALGHNVVSCEDGERAVQLCAEGDFDIVLMDVQMPILDGLEAARRIRQEEARSHASRTPILALTANSLREQIDACFAAGMDACLCKPFLPADLLQMIGVHARRQAGVASPDLPKT
jgi:signal transduction histidine kinase/ActR/RegA family two-component response regulator